MQILFYCSAVALFLISESCKERTTNSVGKGYYEKASHEPLTKWDGQEIRPEYEPIKAVLVSDILLSLYDRYDLIKGIIAANANVWIAAGNDATWSKIINQFSADEQKSIKRMRASTNSVWARDWSPLMSVRNGSLVYLDLNYFAAEQRSSDNLSETKRKLSRPADEKFPRTLADITGSERVSVPLYLEGGNILALDILGENGQSRRYAAVSRKIVTANSISKVPLASEAMSEDEIIKLIFFATGRQAILVDANPWPHEDTKHVDMWLRPLRLGAVLIHSLTDQAKNLINALAEAEGQSEASKVKIAAELNKFQGFLDAEAQRFVKLGFRVERSPTLGWISPGMWSFTNSLAVNNTMFIPRYSALWPAAIPESGGDQAIPIEPSPVEIKIQQQMLNLLHDYEVNATAIYQRYGYIVKPIESTALINVQGAIHCVTSQIPQHDISATEKNL